MGKGKELIRGITGSKGTVVCKIRVVKESPHELVTNPVPESMKKVQVGECLVGSKFTSDQDKYLEKAAALIQNVGGKGCHGNFIAKSLHIPAISDTFMTKQADGNDGAYATEVLKDGQMVVVEGFIGEIGEVIKRRTPEGKLVEGRESIGAIYEYVPNGETISKPKPTAKVISEAELEAKYG